MIKTFPMGLAERLALQAAREAELRLMKQQAQEHYARLVCTYCGLAHSLYERGMGFWKR